jgi:tetratricopeptide (TPR) repeat protein
VAHKISARRNLGSMAATTLNVNLSSSEKGPNAIMLLGPYLSIVAVSNGLANVESVSGPARADLRAGTEYRDLTCVVDRTAFISKAGIAVDQPLRSYEMNDVKTTLSSTLNRAISAYKSGQFVEAEQLCQQIVAARQDVFDALHLLALVQTLLGKKETAVASFDRALKVRPRYAEALSNRGLTLYELKRFDEALASFDEALKAQPNHAEALFNRGLTLHALKRFEEALASFDGALKVRPNYIEALSSRGNVLRELKRYSEALASFEQALKVRSDNAEALSNLGVTLHEMNMFELALASYDRALRVRSDYAEALTNRGITLLELKHFDEALASFDRALTARPDFAEAHCSRALCRMLIGDFDRGWKENEWRWETEHLRKEKRSFAQPLWLGSNEIAGKTMLLHGEQGFGDMIQFCRYVPLVAARGARVILEVPNSLQELMGTLTGSAKIISRGKPLPQFDMHCPLLSLPLAFRTRLESVPSAIPYLRATPSAVRNWNARLGPRNRVSIGLVWSGRPDHKNDHNRSIELNTLLPLLDCDATFVSLQWEVRPCDTAVLKDRSDLIQFGGELNDFSDTAAIISNLDLVISVDTSVAHLAGALGKPTWILLPYAPDWRWLLDREDSPWYPTARLFRQSQARTWDDVITRVHDALHHVVANHERHDTEPQRRS